MKILFSNLPWWTTERPKEAEFVRETDQVFLRIGIRAGSRWPFTRRSVHVPDEFRFGGYLPFPFFMGSAAAYAARELPDHEVTFRDSIARGESYEAFYAYVADVQPDWIVVESATPSWDHDRAVLEQIAKIVPSCRVIVTGTIVAGCDFKRPDGVFAAVKGEYEKGVVEVVAGERDGHVWGHGGGVVDFRLLTLEEMNAIPFPMFDEACALNYADGCPAGQLFPQLQVWTSRGCPYRCVFCAWPATMTGADPDGTGKRRVRGHSALWLEGMLRDRLAKAEAVGSPYQCIYLDDDTLNLTDKHTLAVCDVMERIGLPWSAMCRADTVERSTWNRMRQAGCFGVKLGFESGVQRVVDEIVNKRLDLKAATETACYLRSIGMTVHGTFTVGLPGETPEEQDATRAFIRELYATGALDSHQLSGTAVIEGTPMANLLASGKDLPKYPGAHAGGDFVAMTDGQLKIEQMRRPGAATELDRRAEFREEIDRQTGASP